jgi:hypothetical protein
MPRRVGHFFWEHRLRRERTYAPAVRVRDGHSWTYFVFTDERRILMRRYRRHRLAFMELPSVHKRWGEEM